MSANPDLWRSIAAPIVSLTSDAICARLDTIVPGGWDVTLDRLSDNAPTFKARVQILGVIREGVASGASYSIAADKAFIAAARKFGIATVAAAA